MWVGVPIRSARAGRIHSRNAPTLAPEELMSRVCTRQLGRPSRSSVDARTPATSKHPGYLVLSRQFAARLWTASASGV
jgi:hypothetical protein